MANRRSISIPFYVRVSQQFSTKLSIFDKNFDFRSKFRFWEKNSTFDYNFDFGQQFQCSTEIISFDFRARFRFLTKFRFSTKISIFDQNSDYRPKFLFSTQILITKVVLSAAKRRKVLLCAEVRSCLDSPKLIYLGDDSILKNCHSPEAAIFGERRAELFLTVRIV